MLDRGERTRRRLGAAGLALCMGVTGVGITGSSAAGAAGHRALTPAQVDRIVKATGFRGLRAHHFQIATSFQTSSGKVVVVRIDRARLGVPTAQVRRDIRQAQRLADARRTFSTMIRVGPGPKQRITYAVLPTVGSAKQQARTRYVIFSPRTERLGTLTRPQRVPSAVQALTVISSRGLNVTLLHDGSRAATLDAMVECLNTSSRVYLTPQTLHRMSKQHVNLSYMTDPNHRHPTRRQEVANLGSRGLEIWSNSLGFAIVSARHRKSYRSYVRQATDMRFGFYRRNELRYLKVPAQLYRSFAR